MGVIRSETAQFLSQTIDKLTCSLQGWNPDRPDCPSEDDRFEPLCLLRPSEPDDSCCSEREPQVLLAASLPPAADTMRLVTWSALLCTAP